ncbi:asialoglycoprotein receptor 1 [Epinephelus moara]|uniref:asialoglycoprotein receptor 1 n=1 Tax=Epinephelus moara TaxID=300413 RepID=UPI00214F5C9F|nr:asialoglycoprotein receptor 1 [Epinephelus moara]
MNRKPQDKTEKTKEGAAPANSTVGRTTGHSGEIKEEPVYADVAAPPDQRCLFFTQSSPPIAVCWLILLVIMGLRIYFTAVISENNGQLTAENQELKTLMTQNYTVLENKIANLTEENLNLTTQNKELKRNYNNLTQAISVLQNNWNELNVTRAQWSIDAYCPIRNNERQCAACPVGWIHRQPSCYAINYTEWNTWEEAQKNCRRKGSELAVVYDQQERNFISDYSFNSFGPDGYWIGLRAVDGRWKWVDGSYMTYSSWIEAPTEGHCAISVQSNGWKSVSCGNSHKWICKKKALSL